MTEGVVKFYRPEKGWGAISSTELPEGQDAFVHFSVIEMPGYRLLEEGEIVDFDYKPVIQDSFRFLATSVRRRPTEPAELPKGTADP
jgi:CspA family cold shock protein